MSINLRRARGYRPLSAILLAALFAMLSVIAVASPASAITTGTVDRLEVRGAYSTLSLRFDEPMTAQAAEKVRGSLDSDSSEDVSAMDWRHSLWCGDTHTFSDSNGSFTVAYYCAKSVGTRTVPWGYKLSSAVRSIVVGNVAEKGLTWWNNGVLGGQNAPHVEPPDYLFHGTMKPVYAASNVDCQDYLTFRHNIGPGGTGSVTFAAGLTLVN